jgi:hypothetical protein
LIIWPSAQESRWKTTTGKEVTKTVPTAPVLFTAASARTGGQFGFMDHLVAFCNSPEFAVYATARFADNINRTCVLGLRLVSICILQLQAIVLTSVLFRRPSLWHALFAVALAFIL